MQRPVITLNYQKLKKMMRVTVTSIIILLTSYRNGMESTRKRINNPKQNLELIHISGRKKLNTHLQIMAPAQTRNKVSEFNEGMYQA